MSIAWGSLLVVFIVSFGAAVAVVVLVTCALVGLSARERATTAAAGGTAGGGLSAGAGTAVAGVCLAAAAAIVLYGLYVIVAA